MSCGLLEQQATVTRPKIANSPGPGVQWLAYQWKEISMGILRFASDAAQCMRKGCKTSVSECNHIMFLSMYIGAFLSLTTSASPGFLVQSFAPQIHLAE